MKLIVGLGNPGKLYQNSRHNIGFLAVKALAKVYRISFKKDSGTFSLSARGKIKSQDVILAIPFTFMNVSGMAVSALLKKYKIDLEDLLVVYDDLDLEFGRLKVRPSGSSGGHRGLKSIIYSLGNQAFSRLRLGIGRPEADIDAAEFVLSSFTKEEKGRVKEIIQRAVQCCCIWLTKGVTEAMDVFNARSAKDE
jgi:PTH1 family peptidyl-tRNA hydrolase